MTLIVSQISYQGLFLNFLKLKPLIFQVLILVSPLVLNIFVAFLTVANLISLRVSVCFLLHAQIASFYFIYFDNYANSNYKDRLIRR